MDRRGYIGLLAAGCLWCGTAPAQDRPLIPYSELRSIRQELHMLSAPPMSLSIDWLREEVNPILRERREVRRRMAERAQQSLILKPRTAVAGRDLKKEVGEWRMSIGNTSANNWSPYPDRALDARTLRFPMPHKPQGKAPMPRPGK